MNDRVRVRAAALSDVDSVVRIHMQAFDGFFLTSLGSRFLKRFYSGLASDERVVFQIAESARGACGFAVGPLRPRSFFRMLLVKQGVGFALDATGALLRHPLKVGRKLLGALRYRGEGPPVVREAALLSSLGVLAEARGTGVSGLLIEAFCREAARGAATHVYLTTDRDENAAVNRFYLKHGFVLESSLVRPDGRVMNRYCRPLSGDNMSISGSTAST
jgi:GNAT superfamily N-acetyltransferase